MAFLTSTNQCGDILWTDFGLEGIEFATTLSENRFSRYWSEPCHTFSARTQSWNEKFSKLVKSFLIIIWIILIVVRKSIYQLKCEFTNGKCLCERERERGANRSAQLEWGTSYPIVNHPINKCSDILSHKSRYERTYRLIGTWVQREFHLVNIVFHHHQLYCGVAV